MDRDPRTLYHGECQTEKLIITSQPLSARVAPMESKIRVCVESVNSSGTMLSCVHENIKHRSQTAKATDETHGQDGANATEMVRLPKFFWHGNAFVANLRTLIHCQKRMSI